MPKHPPEAQSGPTPNSSQQPAEPQPTNHTGENLVRFRGSQVIPAIRIIQPAAAKTKQSTPKRRTPRQEERLARLEETRESRAHLADTTPLPATPQGLYHFERGDQIQCWSRRARASPSAPTCCRSWRSAAWRERILASGSATFAEMGDGR